MTNEIDNNFKKKRTFQDFSEFHSSTVHEPLQQAKRLKFSNDRGQEDKKMADFFQYHSSSSGDGVMNFESSF